MKDKYTVSYWYGNIKITPEQVNNAVMTEIDISSMLKLDMMDVMSTSTLTAIEIFRPGMKVDFLSSSELELQSENYVDLWVTNESEKKIYKYTP